MSSKEKFDEWLEGFANRKNTTVMRDDIYDEIVAYLDLSTRFLTATIRQRLRRHGYQLMDYPNLGLKNILVVPNPKGSSMFGPFKRVVKKSDIFMTIRRIHDDILHHQGITKTYNKICRDYENIPRETVVAYLRNCHMCFVRRTEKTQTIRVSERPPAVVTYSLMERVQFDVIDMKSTPDAGHMFIGHMIDYCSQFRVLFPMKGTGGSETAHLILQRFFFVFGMPSKLHLNSDGVGAVKAITKALDSLSPSKCKLIERLPIDDKWQGVLTKGFETIQAIIAYKRIDEGTNEWTKWVPLIQYSMNTSRVEINDKTPFDMMFGRKANIHPIINVECIADTSVVPASSINVQSTIGADNDEYNMIKIDTGDKKSVTNLDGTNQISIKILQLW